MSSLSSFEYTTPAATRMPLTLQNSQWGFGDTFCLRDKFDDGGSFMVIAPNPSQSVFEILAEKILPH